MIRILTTDEINQILDSGEDDATIISNLRAAVENDSEEMNLDYLWDDLHEFAQSSVNYDGLIDYESFVRIAKDKFNIIHKF